MGAPYRAVIPAAGCSAVVVVAVADADLVILVVDVDRSALPGPLATPVRSPDTCP